MNSAWKGEKDPWKPFLLSSKAPFSAAFQNSEIFLPAKRAPYGAWLQPKYYEVEEYYELFLLSQGSLYGLTIIAIVTIFMNCYLLRKLCLICNYILVLLSFFYIGNIRLESREF